MKVYVIIAFRGEPGPLRWALEGFAQQDLPAGLELEVRVGGDGCAVPELDDLLPPARPVRLVRRDLPRSGAAAVRNALLADLPPGTAPAAADAVIIFGNADARPDPDLVRRHVERLATLPPGSLVLGAAPWETPAAPTVFDALLAHTPAVFFYNQLTPGSWYDFRQAWTLNLAMRLADFRRAGGFPPQIRPVYYEDLALGFRILGSRPGVFYDPAARVLHRHPTTLEDYLNREELLGLMAPIVSREAPEVFAALFGRRGVADLANDFSAWVKMDAPSHAWSYRRLAEWAALPEDALGPAATRQRMLMTIYQMHIPLKRLAFRLGFLRGLELLDDARWQDRRPTGLWKKIVG